MNGTQGTEGTTGNQVPSTPLRPPNQSQECPCAEQGYDDAKAAARQNKRVLCGTSGIKLFPDVPKVSK